MTSEKISASCNFTWMTNLKLFFLPLLICVHVHSLAQNQMNSRLFYSKPQLYDSKSKVNRLNFSAYHISVTLPEDNRSKFYGEKVYKNVTTHQLEEFFEAPVVVEIQNKITNDLKKLSPGRPRAKQNELVINPSVEVFYPKVHGFVKARSFAKVRLNIATLLNGILVFQQKYESLYITNGMDNGFEGNITMDMEQGENITVGMALRQTLDQYYADLDKVLKLPDNKIILHGSIINARTKGGVSAPFSFQADSVFSTTSSADGKFKITLPKVTGKVQIIAPNFMVYTGMIIFHTGVKMVKNDFELQPIEKGTVINLKNVLFYMGTANLLESSYDELDAVVAFLKSNPKVKIELNGHTDNQGDAHKDLILSQDRVDRIKNYLVSKKINARRITGKGFGGAKPVASNATEEGRALNRRVEFVILKR